MITLFYLIATLAAVIISATVIGLVSSGFWYLVSLYVQARERKRVARLKRVLDWKLRLNH